jgi:hypothetical protein
VPLPMTAQVATVRQRISVPANFQIANSEASTATKMHALVIQKEILLTRLGLRKPRGWRCSELANLMLRSLRSYQLILLIVEL